MTVRKPSFATGDVITLKGQRVPLTVSPAPQGAVTCGPGWLWAVTVNDTGVAQFAMLHEDTIVKKTRR